MKAPDKIYIEQFPEGHFSDAWHQHDQSTRTIKAHEYIRKDYTIDRILENGVEYVDSKGDENDKMFYLTYEEACEAAIRYCLENLI